MTAKRYFEFSDGSSSKFWEVWCEGASLYVRFGKIGASGQVKVKDLGSKSAAQTEHDKLVKEKTGKGYKEKGGKKTDKPNGKSEVAAVVIDPNVPRYVDVPEGVTYLEGMEKKQPSFFQIKQDGKSYVFTTGEIGTEGKTTKKKLKDEWIARREVRDLVDQHLAKGYNYALTGKPPKRPAVAAVNAQLEASLKKDASDDALEVYADWLQEQGDVRGELAALQLRLAKHPNDKKLAKTIDELLWEQRAYFYGPLAPYMTEKPTPRETPIIATWRAGWIDTLELGCTEGYSGERKVRSAAELIRLVPRVASAKFLRGLVISRPIAGGEYSFSGPVEEVIKVLPSLPTLTHLTLGNFSSAECELSWAYMGPLKKLWPVAQNLEYVKIRAGSMELGKIDLPHCREFRIETGGLSKQSLKSVIEAKWPKLETLSLWFGKEEYGCGCSFKDVAPILDGKVGKLKHLGLKNSQFGDQIFAGLVKSKIVRQLDTLDVSMSHITTETLERDVLPHKAAFAKIQKLDLSRCLLDDKGQKLAKTLAKEVNLDRQYSLDDDYGPDYRYAAVGE